MSEASASGHLFDLAPDRPTTRQVAALVKAGGVSALPAADRRGDNARYQEVVCRSALNRVSGMPFQWTLNPYRGCTHGCHYCFARRYHSHLELDTDDQFSSVILVKVNFPEVLRRELTRPSWTPDVIALGTATDPYQPIEGQYQLTRRTLETLVEHPAPLGLVTKGPLVVRDRDLLIELSRRTPCTVYLSVPTVDEDAWRTLEPGTASPRQRLKAVRQLADAGVSVGVLIAPVVPGITSTPAMLERTIEASADAGARRVSANVLHLEGGTRDHFMTFLARRYPQLIAGYERLYRGKYASMAYVDEVRTVVDGLRRRHGPDHWFDRPRSCAAPTPATHAPQLTQVAFSWQD